MMKKQKSGFSIFGRKKKQNGLPKAVAFVDYEHWYISMEKLHNQKPDIQGWFDDLKKRCNITEVIFFGNFSKFKDKETETKRIRAFTNKIIDTYNPDQRYKKDYTDFIILDNIYQEAFKESSSELFIIFSGDGHFSSATAFLRTFCNKQVGIYGVANCISKNLINSSDWCIEVPLVKSENEIITDGIFTYLDDVRKDKDFIPTFRKTAEIVAKDTGMEFSKVSDTLSEMIKSGYILQKKEKTSGNRIINKISVDWKALAKNGIWKSDNK